MQSADRVAVCSTYNTHIRVPASALERDEAVTDVLRDKKRTYVPIREQRLFAACNDPTRTPMYLHFSRPPGAEDVGGVHDAAQLLPRRLVSGAGGAAAVAAAAPPAPESAGLLFRAVTVVEHLRWWRVLEGGCL